MSWLCDSAAYSDHLCVIMTDAYTVTDTETDHDLCLDAAPGLGVGQSTLLFTRISDRWQNRGAQVILIQSTKCFTVLFLHQCSTKKSQGATQQVFYH